MHAISRILEINIYILIQYIYIYIYTLKINEIDSVWNTLEHYESYYVCSVLSSRLWKESASLSVLCTILGATLLVSLSNITYYPVARCDHVWESRGLGFFFGAFVFCFFGFKLYTNCDMMTAAMGTGKDGAIFQSPWNEGVFSAVT